MWFMNKICFRKRNMIKCLGDINMARFSIVPADVFLQILDEEMVYKIKDNVDKDSPINGFIAKESRAKSIIEWLNENVGDVEETGFDFFESTPMERVGRLENEFGCKVNLENALINDTYLIKLDKPATSLRQRVADALGINDESISIYNSLQWDEDKYYYGDDIAIINRSRI